MRIRLFKASNPILFWWFYHWHSFDKTSFGCHIVFSCEKAQKINHQRNVFNLGPVKTRQLSVDGLNNILNYHEKRLKTIRPEIHEKSNMPSVLLSFQVDKGYCLQYIRTSIEIFQNVYLFLFMNKIESMQISIVHSTFPASWIKCSAPKLEACFLEYTVNACCSAVAKPHEYFQISVC